MVDLPWFTILNHKYQITKIKQITMTKIQNLSMDEIVKAHFSAWIPAFAGMTHTEIDPCIIPVSWSLNIGIWYLFVI